MSDGTAMVQRWATVMALFNVSRVGCNFFLMVRRVRGVGSTTVIVWEDDPGRKIGKYTGFHATQREVLVLLARHGECLRSNDKGEDILCILICYVMVLLHTYITHHYLMVTLYILTTRAEMAL